MNRNKKFRLIDSTRYFLAFLSSFLIFVISILVVLYLTILQPSYLVKEAKKADYYSLLTKEVNRYVQDAGLGSGIPEEALEKAVSEELVEEQVNYYFQRAFVGVEDNLDTTELEADLNKKIQAYATANQVEITPESEAGIQFYLKKIATEYRKFIMLPYLVQIGMRIDQLQQIVTIFAAGATFSFILVSLFLLKTLKWGHRLFRYLSYGFTGAGLMMVVFPAGILISRIILRVGLTSKALYSLVTVYLTDFFQAFIYGGAFLILMGLICLALSEYRRKRVVGRKPVHQADYLY